VNVLAEMLSFWCYRVVGYKKVTGILGAGEGEATENKPAPSIAIYQPSWPPAHVLVDGGNCPTLGHLRRALVSSNVATNADPEALVMARYVTWWSPIID